MIDSAPYLRDRTFVGETFVLSPTRKAEDVFIRCKLIDCEIVLNNPRWVAFSSTTFENCTFITKKQCAQIWNGNRWINCTFIGDYAMHFGFRNEDCSLPHGPMLVDCDFSQVSGSFSLYAADLPTIRFPRWPSITFLEPAKHSKELQSLEVPKPLYIWWYGYSRGLNASISSQTLDWEKFVMEYREFKANPKDFAPYTEEVRSILGKLPYVIM